jgi:hypothetical protein
MNSCSPHEFPGFVSDVEPSIGMHNYTVTIHHNSQMKTIDYFTELNSRAATSDYANLEWRYILKVFDYNQVVYQTTFYSNDFSLDDFNITIPLESLDHKSIYVWSDYIVDPSHANLYYDASRFDHVNYYEDAYEANSELRDCFAGHWNNDNESFPSTKSDNIYINLERPVGNYTLVTTDLDRFRSTLSPGTDLTDYSVVVTYSSYLPNSINLFSDIVNSVTTGVKFESPIRVYNDTVAVLGFDHVLLNNSDDSGVEIQLSLKAPDGTIKKLTNSITIPMHRDTNTNVYGHFLTRQVSSGFGIDYRFDGEYNIFL